MGMKYYTVIEKDEKIRVFKRPFRGIVESEKSH